MVKMAYSHKRGIYSYAAPPNSLPGRECVTHVNLILYSHMVLITLLSDVLNLHCLPDLTSFKKGSELLENSNTGASQTQTNPNQPKPAQPMLVYELTRPREFKYGGELTAEESRRCVSQTQFGPEWEPYGKRGAEVENICGVFSAEESGRDELCTLSERLESVAFRVPTPFGQQIELFHLNGHVTLINAPGLKKLLGFKGVRGFERLEGLTRDLFLPEDTVGRVHMGVFSTCLGKRLQTDPSCYLENRVEVLTPWMGVQSRLEQNNVVRLSVMDWACVGLPEELRPVANDLVITGKGSALHRFKWANLVWTLDGERATLDACQRVSDAVAEMC